MKRALLIITVALLFLSCESTTNEAIVSTTGVSYQQSITNWANSKKQNRNSYTYEASTVSWTGNRTTTQIKVLNDKVIARNYESFTIDSKNNKVIGSSYTENESNLGSNENGAKPVTIEEVYNNCYKDYLSVDTKNNILQFTTDVNGIISACGYTIKNCQDDCFIGIHIVLALHAGWY